MGTLSTKRRMAGVAATVVVASMGLTACGSLDPEGAGGGAGGSGPTIVTVPKLTGISWFTRMEEGTNRYDRDHKSVEAYMQGSGQADANAQVRVIEDLLASGVESLAVVPFQPAAVEPVLGEAMAQDVVVVTHEAPDIKNAYWDVEAFRNEEYGINLMKELAQRMGEEGQYAVMVGSLSSATHMEWVKAAIAYQKENYPKMQQVGDIIETADDSQIAYERMQELLSAYPKLEGFQGSASTDVVGVGQAVQEAGLQDEVSVVGTSTPNDARRGLGNGSIDLITFWDPADAAYAMNVVARTIIDGKKVTDGMDLGVTGYRDISTEGRVIYGDKAWITVTEDNVDEYDF